MVSSVNESCLLRNKAALVALLAVVSGCPNPKDDAPTAPEPAAATPSAPAAAPAPAPVAQPSDVLLDGGELTAQGKTLRVYLDSKHILHVGDTALKVEHAAVGFFWEKQASVGVKLLGDGQPAVLLSTPIAGAEDPPNRHQLFLVGKQGSLIRVFDESPGAYGVRELRFPGDGTMRYVEDGWGACNRTKHPKEVALQEVSYRLNDTATKMIESDRKDTVKTQKCDMLAACPFVYVVGSDREMFVGEILRNLRRPALYAQQSLALPRTEGPLRIRIAEEKKEVTYLDEVHVLADGQRIQPRSCRQISQWAYCRADDLPHLLHESESLTLEFDLPRGASQIELVASGYYVPK